MCLTVDRDTAWWPLIAGDAVSDGLVSFQVRGPSVCACLPVDDGADAAASLGESTPVLLTYVEKFLISRLCIMYSESSHTA